MNKCLLDIDKIGNIEVYTDQNAAFIYPNIKNFFSKVIKSDDICLDIGAHVGLISLLMSYISEKGHVYSFEPSKSMFEIMVQNIELHQLKNITPMNLATFNINGPSSFHNVEHSTGSSHLCTSTDHFSNQLIRCVRLDDWAEEKKLSKVDFIKMDIEGAEIESLKAGLQMINRWKPDLVIEFNTIALSNMGHEPEELLLLLKQVYPAIYLIQPDSSLIEINSYSDLITHTNNLMAFYGINFNNGDLYCTFKQ